MSQISKTQKNCSTWQHFINTLDTYSNSEDLATCSFGPSTNTEFASKFKETLNQFNPNKHYLADPQSEGNALLEDFPRYTKRKK